MNSKEKKKKIKILLDMKQSNYSSRFHLLNNLYDYGHDISL
jgi:hypothetical protein